MKKKGVGFKDVISLYDGTMTEDEAKELWQTMLSFLDYGFNASHACGYAVIAYWCQWLKTYYPQEFWVINLNYDEKKSVYKAALRYLKNQK